VAQQACCPGVRESKFLLATGIGSVDEDFETVTNRFNAAESDERFFKLVVEEL
jgi:hypothetical protein